MKLFLPLFFIIFSPAFLIAQVTVSGKVSDGNGEMVPGANISIKGSYDGASSGLDGNYSFTTYETGEVILLVTYIGYETYETPINIEGENIEINPVLKATISSLDVVVISAGSFEASDERKAVILKPIDIVTTAGANADIFAALDKLPGTSTVGESEGLYVRGGSKYETTYIIDEMVVQNPYFSSVPNVPSRGRFSPFEFKGTVFSTGGYSAQYGQALSSAVILNTQDMAPETFTSVGILPLALSVGHIQAFDKTSIGAFASYNNLSLYFKMVPQRTDWVKPPEGMGGSFNFRQKTSNTGLFKFYSTYSKSKMQLNYTDLNLPGEKIGYNLNNQNIYVNSSFREAIGKKWNFFAGFSMSDDKDEIGIEENQFNNKNNLVQGKIKLTRFIGDYSALRIGGEHHYKTGESSFNGLPLDFKDNFSAAFVEADLYLSHRIVARLGGRYEHSSLINTGNFAPRVSVALKTGIKSQVSIAYGQFFQTPQAEQNEFFYPFYQQAENLGYEKAAHYIANFQHIGEDRTFRIEAYYKDYTQLIKYEGDSLLNITNNGNGYAQGFDLFWRDKKTFKNVDYWISYSFVDSKREYRHYPEKATPTFVAKHNLNVVFKRYFAKLKTAFGASYTFASGRPYYNPNNSTFLSDRTKSYHDLSINASYLTNLWGNFTVVFVALNNILGFDNTYGYRYSSDGSISQAVKAPSLRAFIVGIFIQFKYNKNKNESQ